MICRHIISEMSFLWMFNEYVIQIDHVVPLVNECMGYGCAWLVPAASALLVNDLLNLLAVVVFSMMRVQDSAGDGEPLTCKRMV